MAEDKNGKLLPKGITLRADGRYMGRFKYNGENYVVYDTDLKKITKKLSDLHYEVEHGIYAKESNITVDNWFEIWMRDFKEKTTKPGTQESYQNVYSGCIKKFIGRKQLKDIRMEHIQKIYNTLADTYAEGTIRLAGVVLFGIFSQGVKSQLIYVNPVPLATFPRAREREVRKVLTIDEQKTFLEYAKQFSKIYQIFLLALLTGCRNGEVRGLEWKDIDFDDKLIHITGTMKYVKSIGIYKGTPKTKTSKRDIPMLDASCKLLKHQQEEQQKQKEIAGNLWTPMDGLEALVFTQSDGRPISREIIAAELKKVLHKMRDNGEEIEDFTFHSLRHTFATRGIENGISMKTMQSILGHSSYSMTADLYSHVLPSTKAQEMNKLSSLFEN